MELNLKCDFFSNAYACTEGTGLFRSSLYRQHLHFVKPTVSVGIIFVSPRMRISAHQEWKRVKESKPSW